MNIEKEIRNLTVEITELTEADRATVKELLEHNEWGVAFEHLCAAIFELSAVIAYLFNSPAAIVRRSFIN
ncbi:MafI family immunity protein [Paenibacillus cellulosilyticus]|uniref:MafI family immunity protein n=1 Tax=Paenibacillus cellulosilyticus TaxID=375489 RepID=UPI000D7174F3|nr:MafI family immunity protein [Paenibacillus cellulosilyticus]QKS45650.1 MafI family immunity protein [Paenibacillus cellulosilyticus]